MRQVAERADNRAARGGGHAARAVLKSTRMQTTSWIIVVMVLGSGCSGVEALEGAVLLNQQCSTEFCGVFASADFGPADTVCTRSEVAGCEVVECAAAGRERLGKDSNAGDVSILGAQNGDVSLRWQKGEYESVFREGQAWAGGETLYVSTSGGVVPAFTSELPAPHALQLNAPDCGLECAPFSRRVDLPVSWSGPAGTKAQVTLSSAKRNVERVLVRCELAESPGVVPAAALQKLRRSGDGYTGTLIFTPFTQRTVVAGDWRVELRAEVDAAAKFFTTAD